MSKLLPEGPPIPRPSTEIVPNQTNRPQRRGITRRGFLSLVASAAAGVALAPDITIAQSLPDRSRVPAYEIDKSEQENEHAHQTLHLAQNLIGDLGLSPLFKNVSVLPRNLIRSEGYGEAIDQDMAAVGRDSRIFVWPDGEIFLQIAPMKDPKHAARVILHEVGHAIFPPSKGFDHLLHGQPEALDEVKKSASSAENHYFKEYGNQGKGYNDYDRSVFDGHAMGIGRTFWKEFLENTGLQTENDQLPTDVLEKSLGAIKNEEYAALVQEHLQRQYRSNTFGPNTLGKLMLQRYFNSPELGKKLPESEMREPTLRQIPVIRKLMWIEAWAEMTKNSFEVPEMMQNFYPGIVPAIKTAYEKASGQEFAETAENVTKKYLQSA